jgi:F-type H+-transporting ATPase subunit gamma
MNNIGAIRSHMKSIRQTVKISTAQKLIAGAHIVKARRMLDNSRPYHNRIQHSIAAILSDCEVKSKYLDTGQEIRKCGLLVISADRGLAGGYNQHVIKLASQTMAEKPVVKLLAVGHIGYEKFVRMGAPVDRDFFYTVENPTLHTAREMAARTMSLYEDNEVDCFDVIYTHYRSAVRMVPVRERLFPLSPEMLGDPVVHFSEYESPPNEVLDLLIPKYLKGFLFGCLIQAWMCELNSRVQAMDNAVKNGNKMFDKLSLQYNRARQGAITQEITEIVAGATAMV